LKGHQSAACAAAADIIVAERARTNAFLNPLI
jgi:hypothetical protein